MKFLVLIGDGMADRPLEALGGLTPLQMANTPNMDRLASESLVGSVLTVPEGLPPGSDVANLSILGYDPRLYYSGRAPLEAASMGLSLQPQDVAFRCNLVTLKFDGPSTIMEDYSSGHITTGESGMLIETLKEKLADHRISFYPGVSYRHLMVIKRDEGAADYAAANCTPPHDISGREAGPYYPSGSGEDLLIELMDKSREILKDHPVNVERRKQGKNPATSIWLWGQGKRPDMPAFKEKYGLSGALISAVDLTKGLGVYAGFRIIDVPGVTGYIDTNYVGKARYGVDALRDVDFVYIHVEAPDEAGHMGKMDDKIRAIEDFDRLVVGGVLEALDNRGNNGPRSPSGPNDNSIGDYRILIMPDHATPLAIKTHSREPVPFIIYDSRYKVNSGQATYDESIVARTDVVKIDAGFTLMDRFVDYKQTAGEKH
ncbi:MAG: cofactor-independent phosphoglycerate mutase [Nitrospirae bacterium]|nr:cofactor-independent phosphoglycerate mutase [Nitrospirota bacterium]